MTIGLYFDEDSMRHALVEALRARGIDVLTALEAGMIERTDEEHLEYATTHGRGLVQFQRRGLLPDSFGLFVRG